MKKKKSFSFFILIISLILLASSITIMLLNKTPIRNPTLLIDKILIGAFIVGAILGAFSGLVRFGLFLQGNKNVVPEG